MSYAVYCIIDPRDHRPFYVGLTSDFPKRRQRHLVTGHATSGFRISQIQDENCDPVFSILETCPSRAAAQRCETFWIEVFNARRIPLLNKENPGAKGPAHAGLKWTPPEDELLLALDREGAPITDMIRIFQRTRGAITSRLRLLNARSS